MYSSLEKYYLGLDTGTLLIRSSARGFKMPLI